MRTQNRTTASLNFSMTELKHPMRSSYIVFLSRVRRILGYLSAPPFDLTTPEGNSQERYRLIVVSGVASTIAKAITALVGIVSLPMVLNYIGKDLFGLWVIVTSIVVWMQLFDVGIANGLSNALAEANGRNDGAAASSYLSSALVASTVVAIGSLPLFAVACFQIPWNQLLNFDDTGLSELTSQALLLAGFAFIMNIPLSLVGRVFIAYQRGYVFSITQAVTSVLTLGALALTVHLDLGFLWLIGIMSFGSVTANFILWFAIPKGTANLRLRFSYVSRSGLSRIAASSVPLFVLQCGALLINQLVNVVIVRTTDLSMVADFNVVLKVYLFVFSIAAGLSSPFYPAIREAFEKRETAWVVRAVRHALTVRLIVTLPFAICLLAVGDPILKLWIGKAVATQIGFFGWFTVCLCLMLSASSSLFSEVLSNLDDIWSQISVVLVSAATVLWLLMLTTPILGVAGVFLSMSISTLYPIIWAFNRIAKKPNH